MHDDLIEQFKRELGAAIAAVLDKYGLIDYSKLPMSIGYLEKGIIGIAQHIEILPIAITARKEEENDDQ